MSSRDGDLQLDEIEPGDLLRDRVFDLQAGVDLEKIKIEMRVNKKFHSAGVGVLAGASQAHGGFAYFFAEFRRDDRRWRFLDYLLMAALYGTFALAQRNDATVGVGENLDFDVTRLSRYFSR